MEFNKKLQELRKLNGLTQEELASKLYVSRAAISKWESGRGYPSIDSIKSIARLFSVTLDELLSSDEVLKIAEENEKRDKKHICDLISGLVDVFVSLLLFLPLFALRANGAIQPTSLLTLSGTALYLKSAYIAVVFITAITGIFTLALQNSEANLWIKYKVKISLTLSIISALLFTVSLQPYAAIYTFALLAIKVILLIKRR